MTNRTFYCTLELMEMCSKTHSRLTPPPLPSPPLLLLPSGRCRPRAQRHAEPRVAGGHVRALVVRLRSGPLRRLCVGPGRGAGMCCSAIRWPLYQVATGNLLEALSGGRYTVRISIRRGVNC